MRKHRLAALTLFVPFAFGAISAHADAKPKPATTARPLASRARQQVPQFPADVKARGDKLWNASSPAVKAWANQNAAPLGKSTTDPATSAQASIHARWPNVRGLDTANALEFVLTYEAAKGLQAEAKGKLDSMSEMGEMESLRLQMAMDRLSKMMSTLSNILKKLSDTAESIVQNLK